MNKRQPIKKLFFKISPYLLIIHNAIINKEIETLINRLYEVFKGKAIYKHALNNNKRLNIVLLRVK